MFHINPNTNTALRAEEHLWKWKQKRYATAFEARYIVPSACFATDIIKYSFPLMPQLRFTLTGEGWNGKSMRSTRILSKSLQNCKHRLKH